MKNPRYFNHLNITGSLNELLRQNEYGLIEMLDTIEDATDGNDLVKRLNALDPAHYEITNWRIDRDTPEYTRLVGRACSGILCGHVVYLKCDKEQPATPPPSMGASNTPVFIQCAIHEDENGHFKRSPYTSYIAADSVAMICPDFDQPDYRCLVLKSGTTYIVDKDSAEQFLTLF